MWNAWKRNTTVFVSQVVVGVVAYYVTGDIWFVAFAAASATAVAMYGAFAITPRTDRTLTSRRGAFIPPLCTAFIASVAVIFTATLVTGHAITSTDALFRAGGVAYAVLCTLSAFFLVFDTARKQKQQGAEESIVLLFLVTLPLGIGTILGGAILLARKLAVKPQAA